MVEEWFWENAQLRMLIWIFCNYEFVYFQTVLFWGCILWHFLENNNFSPRCLEALFEYIEMDLLVREFQRWQELIGACCILISLNPYLNSSV